MYCLFFASVANLRYVQLTNIFSILFQFASLLSGFQRITLTLYRAHASPNYHIYFLTPTQRHASKV